LENAAADNLAAQLGFDLRSEGEYGTSILIIDATVDDIQSIVPRR